MARCGALGFVCTCRSHIHLLQEVALKPLGYRVGDRNRNISELCSGVLGLEVATSEFEHGLISLSVFFKLKIINY